jgi:hypothetical protein
VGRGTRLESGGDDAPHGADRVGVETPSELRELLEGRRTEREALQQELDEAVRRRSRATGWLITLGFGPATLLAVLLALFVEGSRDLAVGFAMLGTAVMGVRAYRATRKVEEIEQAMRDPMDGS